MIKWKKLSVNQLIHYMNNYFSTNFIKKLLAIAFGWPLLIYQAHFPHFISMCWSFQTLVIIGLYCRVNQKALKLCNTKTLIHLLILLTYCMLCLRVCEKHSLGRLQHLCGVDIDAQSSIERGLVPHHHHPTFHRAQGRKAATRDCGRSRWSVSMFLFVTTDTAACVGRIKYRRWRNKLLTYRLYWASAWQDTSHPSGAQEDSESCKTPLMYFLKHFSLYHFKHAQNVNNQITWKLTNLAKFTPSLQNCW